MIQCPDCGHDWPDVLAPCPGCGLGWEDVEAAAEYLDRQVEAAVKRATPNVVWPPGILSRVSREAYNAVTRARAFPFMTPAEREAAARSYDQLKEAPPA